MLHEHMDTLSAVWGEKAMPKRAADQGPLLHMFGDRRNKLNLLVVHSEGLPCVKVHVAVERVPGLQDGANKRQSISIQLLLNVWVPRPDTKH